MKKSLHIGLHSQSLNDINGFISGSEITTGCLNSAFLKRLEVNKVSRFSSGKYAVKSQEEIDLMIIEGWHPDLPFFIEQTRIFNPKVIILFWNLSFYGFNGVVKLDIDGFLSNSRKNTLLLNRIKPTIFLMLAADPEVFKPNNLDTNLDYDVVYLGMFHQHKSNEMEQLILHEAKNFDLVIYGSGWDSNTKLNEYWKGKLPVNDIAKLYTSTKVVLGITEDRQRRAGMINNRVFEALACGSCFISEYSQEMENVFGDLIFFSKKSGDTKNNIENILQNYEQFKQHRIKARDLIIKEHTYDHRVSKILEFYQSLL